MVRGARCTSAAAASREEDTAAQLLFVDEKQMEIEETDAVEAPAAPATLPSAGKDARHVCRGGGVWGRCIGLTITDPTFR